jgi:hypothetical protein
LEHRWTKEEEEALLKAVLRLDGKILGMVLGLLCGAGIFVVTNFLVLKGGHNVGLHLKLLNRFFWGYSVTFPGSLVGFVYGCLCGFVMGWFIAWVYNFIVSVKERRRAGT